MSETVRCPKCGGTDATFTPGERYNCPTCGAVKWYDVEPTPPPAREGAVTRWSHDYINGGDDLVEREDGAYVLYTDYAAAQAALAQALEERDSARHICNAVAETLGWAKTYDPSMLPSAVAHLKAQVAAGDAAQAEAERLRGEARDYKTRLETERETSASNQQAYNDLVRWLTGDATYPVLGHAKYQAERITARFTAAADCRVEAMREAILAAAYGERIAGHKDDCGCKSCETADYIAIAIRALPATPAPGPSADTPNAQEKETR